MPSTQTLKEKQKQIDEIAGIFNNNGVYLFEYRGLTVAQMNDLRDKVKSLDANVKVIKNRMAIKYFQQHNQTVGREVFNGPLAAAYANDKFIDVAKIMVEFEKENEKVKLRAGFIERHFADKDKIISVSKMPPKEQLLAQLVGSIAMPLKKMGFALSAPLRNVLILMNNLKDKKEKEEK